MAASQSQSVIKSVLTTLQFIRREVCFERGKKTPIYSILQKTFGNLSSNNRRYKDIYDIVVSVKELII